MNKYLQKNFFARLLALLVIVATSVISPLHAQVNFTAECPQKTIGKNDYLQISFKIENAANIESINPPSFKNFTIASGPNQESGMTSINGKVDQYVAITYLLKPNSTGSFTIPSATAKADGKEFKSNSLSVSITNAATSSGSGSGNNAANSASPFASLNFDLSPQPATKSFDDFILKKGENINDKIKKNLFVQLDVSKAGCYVGEPIVASYKLYSRIRAESAVTDAPSFNGFSVSDIPLNSNAEGIEKYNGREYNMYVLRKVQLYPLQAGTFTLDPIITDNKVSFLKAEAVEQQSADPFFDMMQNLNGASWPADATVEQNITLQSKPVIITVKPLPEENKPADFKGSVGNFTIESSLQKNNLTTDDAGNLIISIAGAGNIQMINAPKIKWPQGIDGYEAKIKDGVDKSAVPMKGVKTFMYPFTISKAGNYIIPAISFSFFDPASASYKSLSTQTLTLYVLKGKGIPDTTNPQIQIAKTAPGISGIFEKYSLYFITGIVLIAGIFLLILKKSSSSKKEVITTKKQIEPNDISAKVEQQVLIPEDALKDVHAELMEDNTTGFYSVMDASLKKYLSVKFKVPAEELTKKRVNEELDKCNVGLGTSLRLSSLMENIELNLYAPPSNINHLKEVYEKASEVISLLDKQVC